MFKETPRAEGRVIIVHGFIRSIIWLFFLEVCRFLSAQSCPKLQIKITITLSLIFSHYMNILFHIATELQFLGTPAEFILGFHPRREAIWKWV